MHGSAPHRFAPQAASAYHRGLKSCRRNMPHVVSARHAPWLALGLIGLLPGSAHASMFAGETLDKVAMGLAWFIVFVMPVVGIIVFWKLHILPEKIAEKRHHPQKDAIQVLCLLSLVFGGLLWPFAWLWAYTRPTTTFLAYGTEKHEDYFHEMAQKWREGQLSAEDIDELHDELDAIAAKGRLPRTLKALRKELEAAAAAAPADAPAGAA
jgi:Protein of unknown function (DUF3302)